MLTTLSAEVIGNLCSKSRKSPFWKPKIQKFSGEACPRTPLVKGASGTRLSIGQVMYIRNPSMQNGWLSPWLVSKFPRSVLWTFKTRKGKHISFSRLKENWIDSPIEFKSGRRRSTSFTWYRRNDIVNVLFPKQRLSRRWGQSPLFNIFRYQIGNDSGYHLCPGSIFLAKIC